MSLKEFFLTRSRRKRTLRVGVRTWMMVALVCLAGVAFGTWVLYEVLALPGA